MSNYSYIAVEPNGLVSAICADAPEHKEVTIREVTRWLLYGCTIERLPHDEAVNRFTESISIYKKISTAAEQEILFDGVAPEQEAINCECTDDLICPHCGSEVYIDSLEDPDASEGEGKCSYCSKSFPYKKHEFIYYTSFKKH